MLKSALSRLARGSLIYGVGGMLQRFMGLLLLPFYTSALSPQDYGVVALISMIGVAMNGLLTLGTGSSMGLLYYREDQKAKRPTIIWSNILLLIGNGVIWYVCFFIWAPELSVWIFQKEQYASLIRLFMFGVILNIITDPWRAYLRMEERAKIYVVITLISSCLSISLSIYFVLFAKIGVTGVILAGTMAHAIMLFVIWAFVGRKLNFNFDLRLFKPLVRIGFPSIFGLFAFLVIDYADRQMIERMLGLSDLGVYSIGYSFGMIMTIAVGAFGSAWSPFFMSYAPRHDEACLVFSRVLSYYVIGFGSMIVLCFFISKPVVLMMTESSFHEAWGVLGLVAGSYALKGCYLIFLPGIYFADKLYYQSVIEWVAALINIGLNIWMIPVYGIFGAAMATFLSYLILPVLAWYVASRYFTVDYQWRRLGVACATVGLTSIVMYQVYRQLNSGMFGLIFNVAVLFAYFFIVYRFLLTLSERKLVRDKLCA